MRTPPSLDEDYLTLVTTGHRKIAAVTLTVLDADHGTPRWSRRLRR
ncbi:hypothetical protein ACX6XY_16495 [Streptomyces sp. O3]